MGTEGSSKRRRSRWFAGLGVLLALFLIVPVACLTVGARVQERRVVARLKEVFHGKSPEETFPRTEVNASARRLEELVAPLGISLARPGEPGGVVPNDDVVKCFTGQREDLKSYFKGAGSVGDEPVPPPGPELVPFLVTARPVLEQAVDLLLSSPLPQWERDLSLGAESPVSNLSGQLDVQRLLLIEAISRGQAGDVYSASRFLEASWTLNQATSSCPFLVCQVISLAVLRAQSIALSHVCVDTEPWQGRFAKIEALSAMRNALELEGHFFYRLSRDPSLFADGRVPAVPFLASRATLDHARRWQAMLDELYEQEIRSLDSEAFFRQQFERIPKWQVVSRVLMPNFFDAWTRAARAELSADLVARVLEARTAHAQGRDPRLFAEQRNDGASRVEGIHWRYEAVPDGLQIEADGDLVSPGRDPLPLSFVVRRDRCTAR